MIMFLQLKIYSCRYFLRIFKHIQREKENKFSEPDFYDFGCCIIASWIAMFFFVFLGKATLSGWRLSRDNVGISVLVPLIPSLAHPWQQLSLLKSSRT